MELPPILDSDEVTITVREPDALTDDDAISFRVPRNGIRTVALPSASDSEANPFRRDPDRNAVARP